MKAHLSAATWPAYLDGALAPAQQIDVERHLAECPACRAKLDTHRTLRHRLERLAVAPSTDATAIERAWVAVRPRLGRRRTAFARPILHLAYGLGSAAVLVLFAVGLAALFSQQAGPTASELPDTLAGPVSTTIVTTKFHLVVNLDASSEMIPIDEGGTYFQPIYYTIELHNDGPAVAENVRITDVVPALLTHVEGSVTGDAVYDPEVNAIVWTGSLVAGETHTIHFLCRGARPVTQYDTAIVNQVVVDDGVHAPLTYDVTTIAQPWPTIIISTPGPIPTRTPWVTLTLRATQLITPTPWVTPAVTLTPWPSPPPPPTLWATLTPRVTQPATPTPWATPAVTLTPWLSPPLPPTLWATLTPRVTQPVTPTPWVTPPATPTPWPPPSVTPTVWPTVTPWVTPTPVAPPTASVTPTPWVTPTPGGRP